VNEQTLARQESEEQSAIYFPYDISFADCESSPATIAKIEGHLAKLERYYDRITDCKVIVRIPHKHGGLRFFHVHIQLDVPGKRLAVSREPEATDDSTDIGAAIKIAFEKITHQLVEFTHARNQSSRNGRRH
jgi:ribosomal subunit interface protein